MGNKNKVQSLLHTIATRYRLVRQPRFLGVDLLCRLLGCLVYCNGAFEKYIFLQQLQDELALFKLSESEYQQALLSYQQGQKMKIEDFESSLRYLNGDDGVKQSLLVSCWRMVWIDRHLGLKEYQAVHLWGYWLAFSREFIDKLGIPYRPSYLSVEHKRALSLLGVTEHMSITEIKHAYKRLLTDFHPDKVIGSGGSQCLIERATQRTIELQEAYRLLLLLHDS